MQRAESCIYIARVWTNTSRAITSSRYTPSSVNDRSTSNVNCDHLLDNDHIALRFCHPVGFPPGISLNGIDHCFGSRGRGVLCGAAIPTAPSSSSVERIVVGKVPDDVAIARHIGQLVVFDVAPGVEKGDAGTIISLNKLHVLTFGLRLIHYLQRSHTRVPRPEPWIQR